jgi:para-aminobenzoate synthetase / 4-amino-4-deoxychorismate lyase
MDFLQFDFMDAYGRDSCLQFTNPEQVFVATKPFEVLPALQKISQAVEQGWYAAGYIAYEASSGFDPAFRVKFDDCQMPLLWFGIFRHPKSGINPSTSESFRISEWQASVKKNDYDRAISAIHAAIARGETYQTNYTFRLEAEFSGDDFAFYKQLSKAQQAAYGAYLQIGRYRLLSASPELFFRWNGQKIVTRPMKGTVRRGRYPLEDLSARDQLANSEKDRAENLMIVDLLRNDLGRIAIPGTVQVPELFTIEQYPTVFQMTSTVSAQTRKDVTLTDVFSALFPCGSITGAPKISTMNLIHNLESTQRGVYCGAIGYAAPNGEAVFNVAIRTVTIDAASGKALYGTGGGITWDSTADGEYEEAFNKARLLTQESPDFSLLETMRLENGEFYLANLHLKRLTDSCKYFSIPLQLTNVQQTLSDAAQNHPSGSYRVRLLVDQNGMPHTECYPLADSYQPGLSREVVLADEPVNSSNIFLYHKTTHRIVHKTHQDANPGTFDVLMWNERGELTEFTNANLVVQWQGKLWTPPQLSGLLAGTMRAELLARNEVQEKVLYKEDIHKFDQIWWINSVRGKIPVTMIER